MSITIYNIIMFACVRLSCAALQGMNLDSVRINEYRVTVGQELCDQLTIIDTEV